MSSTLHLRQRLIDIATKDVGKTELTRNRAPWIKKYWPLTWYPEGWDERGAYCAAAQCYWISEWLKDKEVITALGLRSQAQAEVWRPKTPGAWDFLNWAKNHDVRIIENRKETVLHTGDLIVFKFSHIGLVYSDDAEGIYTIEANTDGVGSREGDGCFKKYRGWSTARAFIRMLP